MIARSRTDSVASVPNAARRHLRHTDSFEYPNRCDWRCSHDIQGELETIPLNAITVEIFVRPMRYKGCHQAHNAKVVICAFFTTPNSLKLQERRKAFLPIRKVRAISQKLYSHSQPRNPHSEIPTASDVPPHHTSRGFLHWRLSDDGPGASRIVPDGRHPKPFTKNETARAVGAAAWGAGVQQWMDDGSVLPDDEGPRSISPEPMIVQHDDREISHRQRCERTERSATTSGSHGQFRIPEPMRLEMQS